MPSHVPAEINLGGSVGAADGAAHPSLRCGAPRVRPQMSLERLLNRARVRAQRAPVLLSLVSKCEMEDHVKRYYTSLLYFSHCKFNKKFQKGYIGRYIKLFEYLYLTRCKASERFFPVGVIPWATCAATWVSISHLLLVVKSQPVDGHLLVSPASVPDSAGWQSAMCFLRAGLVGAITSHEPHE